MTGDLLRIAPAELLRRFGGGAMNKGTRYSNTGMVLEYGWNQRGELTGTCRGSGREIYQVTVTFNGVPSSRTIANARCTCPVGMFCKHGVALLLVAARGGATRPPPTVSWRTMFSGVLAETEPGVADTSSQVRPLALCFGVETPNGYFAQLAGSSDPMLMLYPMTMGKRGKWIKTGASWANVLD